MGVASLIAKRSRSILAPKSLQNLNSYPIICGILIRNIILLTWVLEDVLDAVTFCLSLLELSRCLGWYIHIKIMLTKSETITRAKTAIITVVVLFLLELLGKYSWYTSFAAYLFFSEGEALFISEYSPSLISLLLVIVSTW